MLSRLNGGRSSATTPSQRVVARLDRDRPLVEDHSAVGAGQRRAVVDCRRRDRRSNRRAVRDQRPRPEHVLLLAVGDLDGREQRAAGPVRVVVSAVGEQCGSPLIACGGSDAQ
jgi:hypothetical protein